MPDRAGLSFERGDMPLKLIDLVLHRRGVLLERFGAITQGMVLTLEILDPCPQLTMDQIDETSCRRVLVQFPPHLVERMKRLGVPVVIPICQRCDRGPRRLCPVRREGRHIGHVHGYRMVTEARVEEVGDICIADGRSARRRKLQILGKSVCDRLPSVQEIPVMDEGPADSSGVALRVQRVPEPDQEGELGSKAVSRREGSYDFAWTPQHQNAGSGNMLSCEDAEPERHEAADAGILDDEGRSIREFVFQYPPAFLVQRSNGVARKVTQPERREVVPAAPGRSKQAVVECARRERFPISTRIVGICRHEGSWRPGAEPDEHPRDSRRARSVRTEDENGLPAH